ncbi:MAG: methyltransferase domain-containing protein [Candidatus Caldarchaeum sp.]
MVAGLKKLSCYNKPLNFPENNFDHEWWKKIFNEYYLVTDGDVVCNQELTKYEVDLIVKLLDLDKTDAVLDLCCGNGRHAIELARRGYRDIHGLDYSRFLLNVARNSARQEGLKIDFRWGDARSLPFADNSFDAVILMGNSFGYFAEIDDDLRVLREVRRVLRPYGRILIDVVDREQFLKHLEPISSEKNGDVQIIRLRRVIGRNRLVTREIVIRENTEVLTDHVYGVRLYSFSELKCMLEQAEFANVTLKASISYNPEGKDPGMLKTRMVVTALSSKENIVTAHKPLIAVLIGDPSRRNPVKPGAVLDEDDVYAVNELKSALIGIRKYQFCFLDNHDSFLEYLKANKNSIHIVLNLCDDGFHNDPHMEGHVPALLEMLGLRYTGAGPRCLFLCYDKAAVNAIAESMSIPVPEYVLINNQDELNIIPRRIYPAIVKPNFADNSWGITAKSIVRDRTELESAIHQLKIEWGYHGPVLVQHYVEGKDLTTALIGNPPDFIVLPILTEDYSCLPDGLPRILTYDAKWVPDSPYGCVQSVPATLNPDIRHRLVNWSKELFIRLECRDYARFDWRLGYDGTPWLLEANPNPGWVWDGHLRKACNYMGWSYKKMFQAIIEATEKRYRTANSKQHISIHPQKIEAIH